MNRLGIEALSVFSLPPVEYVTLAADLGCAHISTGLTGMPFNPHGYPPFSLKDDPALRREMIAAMRDRGVSISLGEGLTIRPGVDIADRAAEFDLFSELGAERINAVSMDPDLARSMDQFAKLAEMATALGMTSSVELSPPLTVGDLPTALDVVHYVGRRDFGLLIDTMHVIRSGATVEDLAAVDPALIGYIQVCDVPLQPTQPDYMQEAMFARRRPGEGELPLFDILKVLPRHTVVSLEVPMLALAEAGVGPKERLAPAVESVKAMLARLDAEAAA